MEGKPANIMKVSRYQTLVEGLELRGKTRTISESSGTPAPFREDCGLANEHLERTTGGKGLPRLRIRAGTLKKDPVLRRKGLC